MSRLYLLSTGLKALPVLIILLTNIHKVEGQNLVPNSSFECGVDNCTPTLSPARFSEYACEWSSPSYGTPDVFSTLIMDKHCYSSVPYSGTDIFLHAGSQLPRTGNRFAGLYTYYDNWSSPDYREYLQIKLSAPLIENEKYCAEFYTSGAEASIYYSNNIGMYFNVTSIDEPIYNGPLNFSPQILATEIIADTANWVKIAGTFTATTPAQYVLIGNFFDDDNTKYLFHGPHNDNYYAHAFYFIDDVSVEKVPYDKFSVSGETTICKGENAIVNAYAGVDEIIWTTLTDTLTILNNGQSFSTQPNQTTSYRIKSKGCHKTVIDTITIKVNPLPDIYLGNDTTICEKSELILTAGNKDNSYEWQDLSTSNKYAVKNAGKYSVTTKNKFDCSSFDEIVVSTKKSPLVDIGRDTLVCSGLQLDAGNDGAEYEWSTGFTSKTIAPIESGEYWVSAKNSCGIDRDTILIVSHNDVVLTNVVTLNDDGKNEKITVTSPIGNVIGELSILDRWGNIIYRDNAYDGSWPKSDISTGIYYYSFYSPGCPILKGLITVLGKGK